MEKRDIRPAKGPALSQEQIIQIQKAADGLKYGTVTLIFQDGRLIQIDRNEKMRL